MSGICDVAIVGAGPYALSAAAFLRGAGADVRIFGKVMGFWQTMPTGMLLRSFRSASSIADPAQRFSLEQYETAAGQTVASPVPLQDFIEYGRWYQRRAVPDVDPRCVRLIEPRSGRFLLALDDAEPVEARRVIVAAGIAPFAWRPRTFAAFPPELVSHSSEHRAFDDFRGRRVIVIGGGQSALESAALLHEAGAEVEVLVRGPRVHFLRGERVYANAGMLRHALYPPLGVGPPGLNVVMGTPRLYRMLPRTLSAPLANRAIRPAAATWLRPRLADVEITRSCFVTAAAAVDGRIRLELNDGSKRVVEHVLLGTGFRVALRRYTFLHESLHGAIRTTVGYPVLSPAFESSVEGLHFLGAVAAASAGPGMRFVSHTGPAAAAVMRGVIGRARRARAG